MISFAADLALHREALEWALGGLMMMVESYGSNLKPPPHLAATLEAARRRVVKP